MDDEDAQARSGNTHPDVAEAEHGGRNPTGARRRCRGGHGDTGANQSGSGHAAHGAGGRARQHVGLTSEVLRNKGAPGADGMRVTDLKAWLQAHWPAVKAALLAGSYLPREVRAVDIPKPTGGVRTLGVPTVVDRLIQQAVLQVLQPIFEGGFSESSYGFRPGRNAWQAVQAARDHVRNGRVWVADLDLAKFFDRVNHDLLMARVARRVGDTRVLGVIRRFLEAGLMRDGVTQPRREGTPQGGPLSPLLSNILLTDLDRELERRGHAFARYADDCNVYLGSHTAAEHAFETTRRYLESELKLQVNLDKSAVARASTRDFLGYGLIGRDKARLKVAGASIARLRQRVKALLRGEARGGPCGGGRSAESAAARLDELLQARPSQRRVAGAGRMGQAQAAGPTVAPRQRPLARARMLMKRGLTEERAWRSATNGRGAWWNAGASHMNAAFPKSFFDHMGLVSLVDTHRRFQSQS